MFKRTLALTVLVLVAFSSSLMAAPLSRADIEYMSKKSGVPMEAFAVAMVPMDTTEAAFLYQPDKPMNPASAMKLVTTYSALELLGPHHQWGTNVYADGAVGKDTLDGDLYVRLTGDPQLTEDRLWQVLRDVRNSGVKHVTGNIVIDASRIKMPRHPVKFDDTGGRPYAPFLVEPSPFLVNYNLHHLQGRIVGNTAIATLSPTIPSVELVNQLRVAGTSCPRADHLLSIRHTPPPNAKTQVVLSGDVSPTCKLNRYLSVVPHQVYTTELVGHIWQQLGGTLRGAVGFGVVPRGATVLAQTYSRDVATMMRDINKWSNNVMARQMFLNIGATHRVNTDADDAAAARRAINELLRSKGIATKGMVIENGSGLSRNERLTVRQTAEMLEAAWHSRYAAEFIASLPLVALDGTLRRRMRGSSLVGEGHLKTGSLNNARALAGYMRDQNGNGWVLVVYVNHARAGAALPVIDEALVKWHRNSGSDTVARN